MTIKKHKIISALICIIAILFSSNFNTVYTYSEIIDEDIIEDKDTNENIKMINETIYEEDISNEPVEPHSIPNTGDYTHFAIATIIVSLGGICLTIRSLSRSKE